MGYYTRYSLTWKPTAAFKATPACPHVEAKGNKFCPACGVVQTAQGCDKIVSDYITPRQESMYGIAPKGEETQECKWYEHEKHMREMSKAVPDVLFILKGEGEESGDIWHKYFLNGKMQVSKAVLTLEPYDPKKLD